MSNTYRVRWSINIDAANPEEAARKAFELQKEGNPYNTGYFRVYEEHHDIPLRNCVEVDLGDGLVTDHRKENCHESTL